MSNDLVLKDFSVDFKAPEITVANEKQLANAIKQYASKYDSLVVTEETLADSKKARADLNKLSKALNDRRKEIKRNYNAPLKEFESKIKQWDSNLHNAMDSLDVGINELKDREVAERTKKVEETIAEMAPNYGVEPDEIEMKTNWLTKSISQKKLIDEIAGTMQQVKKDNDALELVKKHCQKNDIPFAPYKDQALAFGALQTIETIDNDLDEARKAKEAREAREKAEKQAEIERQKENTVEVNGNAYDKETGETVREEQKVTFTLQGTEEQITGLARYIKAMGINVLSASEREEVIVKG